MATTEVFQNQSLIVLMYFLKNSKKKNVKVRTSKMG
jgi:hypothetical protein